MNQIIYIKPPKLTIDYSRNVVSSTDPQKAKMEVLKRLDENEALRESLERDKVNQVAVDVTRYGDGFLLIEGFCRATQLTDMYDDGIQDVLIKCEVHDIDPDDRIAFWDIQMKNESRTSKTPLARAMTAKRCYDELKAGHPEMKQCDVARSLGISTGMLSNYLAVASDTQAVDLIRNGSLGFTTAQLIVKGGRDLSVPTLEVYEEVKRMTGSKHVTHIDVKNTLDKMWISDIDEELDDVDQELDGLGIPEVDDIQTQIDTVVASNPLEVKKRMFLNQFHVDDPYILQTLDEFVNYASNI
jgi:hypothetical protein